METEQFKFKFWLYTRIVACLDVFLQTFALLGLLILSSEFFDKFFVNDTIRNNDKLRQFVVAAIVLVVILHLVLILLAIMLVVATEKGHGIKDLLKVARRWRIGQIVLYVTVLLLCAESTFWHIVAINVLCRVPMFTVVSLFIRELEHAVKTNVSDDFEDSIGSGDI